MPDTPGPAATNDDTDFTLSIEEVAGRYAAAGHPRTIRTLQRYCVSGHLDCRKAATALGDKYFITSQSVVRHISQVAELAALGVSAISRDRPRQDAHTHTIPFSSDSERQAAVIRDRSNTEDERADLNAPQTGSHVPAPALDLSRQAATGETAPSSMTVRLEAEVDRLRDDITFLRQQITTKDDQIASLLERDKETNFLVRGLQQMLTPLLSGSQSRPTEPDQSRY